MRRFWDRRAEEDPFFFVDSRMEYGKPDLERFWADGKRDLDKLLDSLGVSVQSEDRILEIGCGVGRLTRVLAARGASVSALDVSRRMLDKAAELNPGLSNVRWILGDGSSLAPVATSSVDVCVSHVVFQHIPEPAITLGYVREMGRVLRPGGWAAFQLSNHPQLHAPGSLVTRGRDAALALVGRGPQGQHHSSWVGSMVELDDLRSAAASASMEVERLVGEGTLFCAVLTRRLEKVGAE
jgi:SAM-dependent methyltransferase